MRSLLARLMRHAAWADARSLDSLRAMPAPPQAAIDLLAHVVTAERIYLERLSGADPFPQDFWPALSLEGIAAVAAATAQALPGFVSERDDDTLRRPVRYRDSRGSTHVTPAHEMLLHVALHGQHHRGQIAALVRAAGGEPAITDFIAFVRERPSAADT